MRIVAWAALVTATVALWLSPRAGGPISRPWSDAGSSAVAEDGVSALEAPAARPRRNLFRFGGGEVAAARPVPLRDLPEPQAPVATTGPRLVGFIEQGQTVRAALAVAGRVVLVAPGEAVEGYAVLGVDPDQGVTLRSPEGEELELPAR